MKKFWNHRVIKISDPAGEWFQVHEVFYENDKAVSFTDQAVAPSGETPAELRRELEQFLRALDLPILDRSEVIGSPAVPSGEG